MLPFKLLLAEVEDGSRLLAEGNLLKSRMHLVVGWVLLGAVHKCHIDGIDDRGADSFRSTMQYHELFVVDTEAVESDIVESFRLIWPSSP